ncbi:MAG: 50S ribosomal protein L21 [Actinomycetota bacterium]|nr:50S ribosomal protein L21 [Actinomycetota bacterium]
MYAVIKSGGKQEKVAVGDSVRLELLDGLIGDSVEFDPILVVDEGSVVTNPSESAKVKGEIVGFAKGPKVDGFVYKNKSNNRRRFGHRQKYILVKVLEIVK